MLEECLVVVIATGMLSVDCRVMFGYDCYRNVVC